MAFFKFRKDSDEHAAVPSAPESVEALRKRARYRLTGAVVLVLAGVVGFPLLFDSQPRPIAVDIPIVIPDKSQVSALAPPPAASAAAGVASGAAVPASAASIPVAVPVQQASSAAVATAARASAERGATKPDKATVPAAPASYAAADAARAQALLDGKSAPTKPAASATGRFVVQFGSYSDAAKAHEARLKVERAGFKTYAQVAQGADGKRFRVRVGPFVKRADAEQAAEKIKKLNLPASILALQE